ncbi:probable trehalose-phosphate phosphatase 2 [Impatiens glandulifera]|uniref:probable trehalose-phosphate phosphatase 2 n=1 Tax=Impatiens glandulifera TaxID=253017 RepID=UPI001FB15B85|nr:probable trehalose-phosphate phosphatase 2 [Impatiens glandulifera]
MIRSHIARLTKIMRFERPIADLEDIESITKSKHDTIGLQKDGNDKTVKEKDSSCYTSWLNEHPSALSCFQAMLSTTKGRRIVVFLDYDGTLSPIVNDPDLAFMSEPMRLAVREVANRFPTAIISGRSRHKVSNFVKLDEVYYAGSHGMDIIGPPRQLNKYDGKYQSQITDGKGNQYIVFQPAQEFLPVIKEILAEMEKVTSDIKGSMIEDNGFCISVHYRHVHQQDYDTLQERVQLVLRNWPEFHITEGKKVMEIRPSIKWDKGDALKYLLETFSNMSNYDEDVIPIYLGDDRTDEDAFKVLRSMGIGYPIIVSSEPRETLALYSLRDPKEVLYFLTSLAKWKDPTRSPVKVQLI